MLVQPNVFYDQKLFTGASMCSVHTTQLIHVETFITNKL